MADVFLSYSREDQPVARRYADALERAGFSVWWDQTLRSGETYDEVTEQALRAAKAVVVLWSKASIASRWVRAEATIADRNRTLVPVMIEHCDRPVMFELTQTADLTGWQGEARDPRWLGFLDDIRRTIGRSGASGSETAAASMTRTAPARGTGKVRAVIVWPIAAVLVAALAAGGWMYMRKAQRASVSAEVMLQSASVAVLPFANLTGDAAKDYFGDGMAEELINALAKVPGLKVASRTSSFAYKGRTADIRQIARDLDVVTVLEGSVRSAGDRVRITTQLINAQTGYHMWSEAYDYDFKDIFTLQDDLASKTVAAFRRSTNLPLDFKPQGPPTSDVQAYTLYLQGAAQLARNSDDDARRGIRSLEEAVARDPQFGQAWLMLSVLKSSLNEDLDSIESDARRAEQVNPALAAGARTIRAAVEARRARWLAAEELLQGITVEESLGYEFFGLPVVTRWATGRLQRVIEDFETATRLAPAHSGFALNLAMAYAAAGRHVEAASMLDRAVTLGVNPDARRVVQLAASIASQQGRFEDAAASMVKALSASAREAGGAELVREIFQALRQPSRRAAAAADLQAFLRRQPSEDWVIRVFAMHWYSQLGRPDLSLATGEDLRRLLGDTLPTNAWAWLWQPEMRETQRAPGFGAFAAKLGMVPYWEKYGAPDGCELKAGQLSCG